MDSLERYLSDTYELVDVLKNSAQSFIAVVYDKRAKKFCIIKQRELRSLPIYQTLKELNNPHVPQIYRLFEREGKLIVVEEHIDGQTLEEILIYQPATIDETFAKEILLQLCECLSVLHEKNIIHRDLKPSNIMLTGKNSVKLIDFGIARIFNPEKSFDTEILGTRGYASPEQFGLFDFGQTNRRSDIYSLGMTIKNLLGEDYDGRLRKILDKCTALEPNQRFQSVEELRVALLTRKNFWLTRKTFAAVLVGLAIFSFPKTTDFQKDFQAEETFTPIKENLPEEKISSSVEETRHEEKIFNAASIQIPTLPQISPPEINLSPPAPVSNTNTTQARQEEKSSGKVELKLFLNGELTGKEHMVYLDNWQSWRRDNYGQFLFPDDWRARLRVENNSDKDLISPQIAVNIGEDKKKFDVPTIAKGQSFDLDIPLGNKLASPEKGSGHLQIILQAEGLQKIFLNKTFFLKN